YPETAFYQTEDLLTQLGVGEALITMLNEKGIPTPLAHTMLIAPKSRMDILTSSEIDELVKKSKLFDKYNQTIDSLSAHEILTEKLEEAAEKTEKETGERPAKKAAAEKGFFDHPAVRQAGRTAASMITRSLLGVLGLGG